ncbi:heavy metal translocating P-type ATPase [Gemmatimonas aurantiaca]|uniref:heavy metal translocating P-type ATPase n=1 Tax=Gemmatimonas aurantiaca TaxID=173480 RepID=UPI00301CAF85
MTSMAAPETTWYGRNRELVLSLVSGSATAAGWILESQDASRSWWLSLYVAAYVFGAADLVMHQVRGIRTKGLTFDIDLLMLIAALGAAALGAWREGALLLFLFSLGHALQHYAMGRARRAIEALRDLAPTRATVLREQNGSRLEESVAIEQVTPGDIVVIKPAERIAVDGEVTEGRSSVNQAAITGESVPVEKSAGAPVYAGTVNGEGSLLVRVTVAIGDRTLDRVVRMVAEARTQQAPSQELTKRFERIFVPIVLIVDVLLMVAPPLLGLWTWGEAFYRAMALLVAASPCALALGTPAAVLSGIAQSARRGVLIKGGAHLEMLGTLTILALDKTGTVTKGEPEVTEVIPADGVDADHLVAISSAVERRSQHPLARAVVMEAERRGLTVAEAADVQSVVGRGVTGRVGSDMVEVGRLSLFTERGLVVPELLRARIERLERDGRSTMTVRRISVDSPTGMWLGVLGVADQPRPGVREILDDLRRIGIRKLVMLTGDNAGVARAIGGQFGFDDIRAGLLPEGKVEAIEELALEGPVGMVGDGVNDAPALTTAAIGIAMGGAGTAAALETADVALMADDLGQLPFAVGLSRATRRVIRQNIAVSLGVIGVLIVATVTGASSIGLAVLIHEGSTLVVVGNALRLLRYGSDSL